MSHSYNCICTDGEIEILGTPDPLCEAEVHNTKPAYCDSEYGFDEAFIERHVDSDGAIHPPVYVPPPDSIEDLRCRNCEDLTARLQVAEDALARLKSDVEDALDGQYVGTESSTARGVQMQREALDTYRDALAHLTAERAQERLTKEELDDIADAIEAYIPKQDIEDGWRGLLSKLRAAASGAGAAVRPPREPCVIGEYCPKHGFIHGAEAEELRERFEELAEDADTPSFQRRLVRKILDNVDARDSAARLEKPTAAAGVSPAARAKGEGR